MRSFSAPRAAFTVVVTFCLPAVAVAGEPSDTKFVYQGHLKQQGTVVTATCDMVFSLWNDPDEPDPAIGRVGDPVYFDDDPLTGVPVEVQNGLFAVELDFGTAAYGAEGRWLDVAIDCVRGEDTPLVSLSPRQLLTGAPYSIRTRGIYVDEAGQVGIGTNSPSSMLHLRNNSTEIGLKMKVNRSWTAELRQTDSSVMSLINGGIERLTIRANGRIGIGTTNPSQRLEVNGNIKLSGDVMIPPTTRYLMISSADMIPRESGMSVYRSFGDVVSFFTPPGQDTTLYAPVHLPDGAEVTEIRAFLSDNASDQDVFVWLEKYSRSGGVLTLGIIYTEGTPSQVEAVDDTIESPVIDNSAFAYYLVVRFTVPPDDGETHLRVKPVRIAYTVTSALP
jgi:hypothetical protein